MRKMEKKGESKRKDNEENLSRERKYDDDKKQLKR